MGKRVGFVGTRFAGLDGVSLEAAKWAKVITEMGHEAFWFAGELDKPPEISVTCPQAYFKNLDIEEINGSVTGVYKRPPHITEKIYEIKSVIKKELSRFVDGFGLDMLIVENALSIPMNLPLGMALTEYIAETCIPVIGHHHDFAWERDRYLHNAMSDILAMSFPPDLPSVKHVVINSIAQKQLAARKGLASLVIPNVIDFDAKEGPSEEHVENFRKDFGFEEDDIIFLQPTRIVSRKGIEHSIELIRRLEDPRIKLVITHSSSDEGLEYYHRIIEMATYQGIPIHFINNKLHNKNSYKIGWERIYTLWDVYPFADFITYPSSFEGFGNAFLEAIYFKKPILVNRYSIFIADIEPKGFKTVSINSFIGENTIASVKRLLYDKEYRQMMVDVNYRLGKSYYSFDLLRRELTFLLSSVFGVNNCD